MNDIHIKKESTYFHESKDERGFHATEYPIRKIIYQQWIKDDKIHILQT